MDSRQKKREKSVLSDIGAAEQGLELVRLVAVVGVVQHRQPAGLAEPAGPDEKSVAHLLQVADNRVLYT